MALASLLNSSSRFGAPKKEPREGAGRPRGSHERLAPAEYYSRCTDFMTLRQGGVNRHKRLGKSPLARSSFREGLIGDAPAPATKPARERAPAADRRFLHDDEAGAPKVTHNAFGGNCGHAFVGLVGTFATLKAQREGDRRHHGARRPDFFRGPTTFAANAVRLQLHALAYNLGNFLRTLATPEPIKDWSLTSLKEKLIKVGAKVVSHSRYVAFQMAEVAIPRNLFAEILQLITELRPPTVTSTG